MKQIILAYSLVLGLASSQTVNNVRVVNHIDYILKVIQDTVTEVEHREWCNLKLPDITVPVNETVVDSHYFGTATYFNGFVVSIQHIDVLQSTVQQVWSWNNTDATGTVSLRGTLRMTNLAIGYDVAADLEDGQHRYTSVFRHPLISFAFSINYNTHTEDITITVDGTVPNIPVNNLGIRSILPDLSPNDRISAVLTMLFNPLDTASGIIAWGPDVFQPITADVVKRVAFPKICYNCPLT